MYIILFPCNYIKGSPFIQLDYRTHFVLISISNMSFYLKYNKNRIPAPLDNFLEMDIGWCERLHLELEF